MSIEAKREDMGFYEDNSQHICDELRLLDLRIQLYLEYKKNAGENFFNSLAVLPEEVEQLIYNVYCNESPQFKRLENQIKALEHYINSRVSLGVQKGRYLPLYMLSIIMGLSPFEYYSVIACLAIEVEVKYQKIYVFLNNDITNKFPTIHLVQRLLRMSDEEIGDIYSMFTADRPLAKYLLTDISQELGTIPSFISKPLKLDERIVGYLLGSEEMDKRIGTMTSMLYPHEFHTHMLIDNLIQKRLNGFVKEHLKHKQNMVFYLYGKDDFCKLNEIKEFGKGIGKTILLTDLKMLTENLPIKQIMRLLEREILLTQSILCIKNFDILTDHDFPKIKAEEILGFLDDMTGIVFLMGKREWRHIKLSRKYLFTDIYVEGIGQKEALFLWKTISNEYKFAEKIDWDIMSSRFQFNEEQIKTVFEDAFSRTVFGLEEGITAEVFYSVCNFHMQHGLGEKTLKIKPIYGFEDIILPNEQKKLLKSLCNQMKYRNVVYRDWGFDRKLSYGKGINAVFSGPPGTGKTMAAQVIARELGMDLYRIDLSQVVSKYIGETEKNLHVIFEDAGKSNAILFFDEADALFGKRSEVKEAKDRFANMEISYLLQKVEEYEGITIMATNLCGHMDEAFKRRIQFIVDFPFPNAQYRKKIWESQFPKEAPLSENVDFDFLAEVFEVSGGNIKNIAVLAAFNAAEMSANIGMEHIIMAARYELKKMGKICSNEKLAMYWRDSM